MTLTLHSERSVAVESKEHFERRAQPKCYCRTNMTLQYQFIVYFAVLKSSGRIGMYRFVSWKPKTHCNLHYHAVDLLSARHPFDHQMPLVCTVLKRYTCKVIK